MTITPLIPTLSGTLSARTQPLCNARDLHGFLKVGRDFTTWIKGRIEQYGFVEGQDYLLAKTGEQVLSSVKPTSIEVLPKMGENLGGRPSIDYHLSLNMAKELAMVENNAQGREVRRYFIQMEAEALALLEERVQRLEQVKIRLAEASPEVQRLIRYREADLTLDEITTLMGCSRRKVAYMVKQLQMLELVSPKRTGPKGPRRMATLALMVEDGCHG